MDGLVLYFKVGSFTRQREGGWEWNSRVDRPLPTGHQPVLAEPARTLGVYLVYRLEMVREPR